MTFRRFEEIRAWQTARALRKAVYEATAGRAFKRDFGLKDQIRRAAVSVMANIAEGFGCRSDREFVKFLFDAKRSVQEVQSHLYAASDEAYITGEQFKTNVFAGRALLQATRQSHLLPGWPRETST